MKTKLKQNTRQRFALALAGVLIIVERLVYLLVSCDRGIEDYHGFAWVGLLAAGGMLWLAFSSDSPKE
jgi:hypothetical protein